MMPSLEDDIARIAALRGKSAVNYVTEAQSMMRRVSRGTIGRIFLGNPDPAEDLRFYDRLPARSRAFMRECVLQLNAGWWAEALHECGNEETVVGAVLSELPYRVHDWVMKHYDCDHPSARRLT